MSDRTSRWFNSMCLELRKTTVCDPCAMMTRHERYYNAGIHIYIKDSTTVFASSRRQCNSDASALAIGNSRRALRAMTQRFSDKPISKHTVDGSYGSSGARCPSRTYNARVDKSKEWFQSLMRVRSTLQSRNLSNSVVQWL